jgi:hypothetical protein
MRALPDGFIILSEDRPPIELSAAQMETTAAAKAWAKPDHAKLLRHGS